jgi:hypothetical protein
MYNFILKILFIKKDLLIKSKANLFFLYLRTVLFDELNMTKFLKNISELHANPLGFKVKYQ